jgi:hypothetical protein
VDRIKSDTPLSRFATPAPHQYRQKYRFSLRFGCGISIAVRRHGHESKNVLAHHGYSSRPVPSSRIAAAEEDGTDRLPQRVFRASPGIASFKDGLRGLGWIEGKNITFEYRYGGGQGDKYSGFATELVRLNVDVIVAGPGNGAPRAAKRVTETIPIVMVAVIDPVRNGLVTNLARPGANITGITFEVTREQAGKNLDLLKEVVPTVTRVAILRNPSVSTHIDYGKEAERAAKVLGLTIQFAEMTAPSDKDLGKGPGYRCQRACQRVAGYSTPVLHRSPAADN